MEMESRPAGAFRRNRNKVKVQSLIHKLAVSSVIAAFTAAGAHAAQLENDARSAIPSQVQQIIVVDYHAMQNSPAAMDLKARILPPELKELENALKASGFNENHDVDDLAFAAFRTGKSGGLRTVGIAQGQFSVPDIMANFKKKKIKPTMVRSNALYPMGASGMTVVFLNPTTMIFGSTDAIRASLDARDGLAPNFLTNRAMMGEMGAVDSEPIWSILDQKGTQYMMKTLLGQASQVADYNTVKKRLLGSRYTMNFQNGVKFALVVNTPDTFTAATLSSLLNAAAMYEKISGSAIEKQAIDATTIDSSAGDLEVKYASSDSQFSALLESPLFKSVVK